MSAAERQRVRQRTPPSYCAECDEESGCGHGGARYHKSWFDLRVNGTLATEYQAWFDANPWGGEEREAPKARSLDALRSDLSTWLYLDPVLSSRLERAYEENDRRTSMMVQDLVRACEQGRLMRPAATLASRLKNQR